MQWDPCIIPDWSDTCCLTCMMFSVSTVDSSPDGEPLQPYESLTTLAWGMDSTPVLPTWEGSAAQNDDAAGGAHGRDPELHRRYAAPHPPTGPAR